MNLEMVVAFGLYILVLGIIGFLAYRQSNASADFTLGSRSLSYWVTALAAHASDMSGWLFMAFPAAIYEKGMMEAWTAVGLTFFMWLSWKYVAPKLRSMTEHYHSETLPSFFEERFGDTSGTLRLVSAFFCLLFFTFYIAANFFALGHLFDAIFNVSYTTGIAIGSLVVCYILLGGFLSIAWIDCFQGIFLLGMIILVPCVVYGHVGGVYSLIEQANLRGLSLSIIPRSYTELLNALMTASWGLGYFGMPHIITKFMGIRDVKEMKKAMHVGIAWQTVTLLAAVSVGLLSIAYFPNDLAQPSHAFIIMTKELFTPFVAGLILCAILASAINVMGAQILSCASVLAEDCYKKFARQTNKVTTAYHIMIASRVSVLAICLIAFTYAYFNREQTIYDLVLYAWTGLGCSFGPLVLVALHTQLRNKYAALAGIVVGGLTAGLWPFFNTSICAMIPGFAFSLAAIWLVNMMTKSDKIMAPAVKDMY